MIEWVEEDRFLDVEEAEEDEFNKYRRVIVKPIAILERKIMKKENRAVAAGLIWWSNSFPEYDPWKEIDKIQMQFLEFSFDSWG